MEPFSYSVLPSRVVFGSGTITRVKDEVSALGCKRALVVSTQEQESLAKRTLQLLEGAGVGVFPGAIMHTPLDVTGTAMKVVEKLGADCIVAVGGGSTIGLSKAIAFRTDLPQIAVPTTYAGSEATPIFGELKDQAKVTNRSPKVQPEVIIYDVELTLSLPTRLTATSGLNAIAHAAEALYARDANPVTSMMAEEAIRVLAKALPASVRNPHDPASRSDALYGAWLCGVCLGTVGMALHHKLCHTLGGRFNLPHSDVHAVILPYAIAYTAPAIPEAVARMSRALNSKDPAQELYDLARELKAPASLEAIGMPRDGLDEAADLACASPYWNPRPVERPLIRQLLEDAFYGTRP